MQLNDPGLLFFTPNLDSWRSVLSSGILDAAARSFVVAFISVAISLVVGCMGAYAITRYRAGGTATRFGLLAAQMIPPAVLVFPFLTMAYALRLQDSLVPVVFAHLSFVAPVVTWFLIGFFEAVPKSIEEQARVDGLGRFGAFLLVVLPQVLPGIGASAIFGFTLSWNDMFYGLILAPGNAKILPVAIAGSTRSAVYRSARCAPPSSSRWSPSSSPVSSFSAAWSRASAAARSSPRARQEHKHRPWLPSPSVQ